MNRKWMIKRLKNVTFKSPIMIEGLPGMGNVGKITVDFIIESLKATKIYELSSSGFPGCVFVNEKGIAELPKVEIYHKKVKGKDLLFVSGDMQPIDDFGCYELCDKLLDLFQISKGKEVITLGGMGLAELPKNPKIYCVGTDTQTMDKFLGLGVKNAKGVVGPIVGVSGLLVGLAKQRALHGVVLLIETLGVQNYLGIKEARELLKLLNKQLNLGLNIQELNKEIKIIEKEINEKLTTLVAHEEGKAKAKKEVTNYIG